MHLYIHVPFCHRICPYCAFFKHTPGRSDIRGYAQAVGREAPELLLNIKIPGSGMFFQIVNDLLCDPQPDPFCTFHDLFRSGFA